MNSTNVLSSHWFCFVWLAYSGNKFFRVGPNISEKCVPGGTNFRGVKIKRDSSTCSFVCYLALQARPFSSSADRFQYPPCDNRVDKIRVDSKWHVGSGLWRLMYLFTLSLVKAVHAIELPSLASQTLSVPQHRLLSVSS